MLAGEHELLFISPGRGNPYIAVFTFRKSLSVSRIFPFRLMAFLNVFVQKAINGSAGMPAIRPFDHGLSLYVSSFPLLAFGGLARWFVKKNDQLVLSRSNCSYVPFHNP